MRETLRKGLSLGLGLAVTTKEQVKKDVDELVEKGEMTRESSTSLVNHIVEEGQQVEKDIDEKIQKKVKEVLDEFDIATRDDIRRIEQRLNELEDKED